MFDPTVDPRELKLNREYMAFEKLLGDFVEKYYDWWVLQFTHQLIVMGRIDEPLFKFLEEYTNNDALSEMAAEWSAIRLEIGRLKEADLGKHRRVPANVVHIDPK